MFGGIILYLSMFYKRHQLMFRLGVFYCAAPLSGAFGGLLATGLAQINYGGYDSWPWIFFVEGAITVVAGIVAFFFLPDTPGKAKFLSEEEQWYITHVLRVDLSGAAPQDKVDDEKFNWNAVSFAHGGIFLGPLMSLIMSTGPILAAQRQHHYNEPEFLPHPGPDLQLFALPSQHHQWTWLQARDCTALHRPAQLPSLLGGSSRQLDQRQN